MNRRKARPSPSNAHCVTSHGVTQPKLETLPAHHPFKGQVAHRPTHHPPTCGPPTNKPTNQTHQPPHHPCSRPPQEDEVIAFQRRLEADAFDFNDFLDQFKRMNNMGGLQMLKLMPGFNNVSEKQLYEVEKKLKRYESMISSMTAEVRDRQSWQRNSGICAVHASRSVWTLGMWSSGWATQAAPTVS